MIWMGCERMYRLVGIWLFELLWCLSDMILRPRKLACDKAFAAEASGGKFDIAAYYVTKKYKFYLQSEFGYKLSCELLEPENFASSKDRKVAILCHGFGCSRYSSLKYAQIFLRLGIPTLIYDHRNHGYSGKAHTTMGFKEKYDLTRIVDWCIKKYGTECKIITHGESMGAATVLLHLGIDPRVDLTIADCAYSDLVHLLRHQLKQYYHLPSFLIPIESCLTFFRAGFWYKEVSPIRVVSRIDTPILFIHGKCDNFVPTYMSKLMYYVKKDKKALYLVAKAKHAESICKNRKGYETVIEEFIGKVLG